MAAGTFQIYQDRVGDHRFRLNAANGQTLLVSEAYKARAGAEDGVESVRRNAPDDSRYRRSVSANGKFYFSLLAANGEVIATSEIYGTEAARDAGVTAVKAAAAGAAVEAV